MPTTDTTPRLALPYIADAQAQKHVTHNEALRRLDAITQLSVATRTATAPPATPAEGAAAIVPAAATGAWSTFTAGTVAAFQDGGWVGISPRTGWRAWVETEAKLVVFDGALWVDAASGAGSVNPTPLVGVATTADATNRLAVASPATLFTHAGNGHQLKLNKAAATDTAALLFQTAFSGRAELGLTGDDHFHVKVSADGSTWKEAILIDRASGAVSLPFTTAAPGGINPNLLVNGDFQINQRGFPGGTLAAGIYGFDRWKADTGGASATLADYTLTLASGTLVQVIEPAIMAGVTSLASTPLTVSVEAPSADLTVTCGTASATITAGSGRRAVTLTTGAGDNGNLVFKLARAGAGSVTFGRVKVEVASTATGWQARPIASELAMCQRYFVNSEGPTVVPSGQTALNVYTGFVFGTTSTNCQRLTFPVAMRAVPTITFFAPATSLGLGSAGAGEWIVFRASGWVAVAPTATFVSRTGVMPNASGAHGFSSGSGTYLAGGFTAAAEL